VVERLILLADTEVDVEAVRTALPLLNTPSPTLAARGESDSHFTPLADRVSAFERATVLAELDRNHNHVTNTAKALGIERSHLYKKCQQLGINLRTS
jgi:two-component system, NtrC family, nitrogen regulation response regulator NtrX